MIESKTLLKTRDISNNEIPEPLYRKIAGQLRQKITSRQLKLGDKLPAISMLVNELGVNYRTIKRAYTVLESDGLVKVKDREAEVISMAPSSKMFVTGNLAMISSSSLDPEDESNFFTARTFLSVSDAARKMNYTVHNYTINSEKDVQRLQEEVWSGIICTFPAYGFIKAIPASFLQKIPTVFLSPIEENRVVVSCDDTMGISLAMDHLYQLGHRRIAVLVGKMIVMVSAQTRFKTYLRKMAEFDLKIAPNWILMPDQYVIDDEEAQEQIYRQLFESGEPPTAILSINYFNALLLLQILHRHGIKVPDDVSVIGYDDLPTAAFTSPPLTTVRQPLEQRGALAVAKLDQMVRGENATSEILPVELIVRRSTGPVPVK